MFQHESQSHTETQTHKHWPCKLLGPANIRIEDLFAHTSCSRLPFTQIRNVTRGCTLLSHSTLCVFLCHLFMMKRNPHPVPAAHTTQRHALLYGGGSLKPPLHTYTKTSYPRSRLVAVATVQPPASPRHDDHGLTTDAHAYMSPVPPGPLLGLA